MYAELDGAPDFLLHPPPASVDHAVGLVLAAELTPTPADAERGAPRAARDDAAVVADVDHVLPAVVLAELGVAVAFHRERGLLDARLFLAPRPGKQEERGDPLVD